MNFKFYKKKIKTVIGELTLIGSEKGLYAILWEKDSLTRVKQPQLIEKKHDFELFIETEKQLNEYFAGTRKEFSIQLDFGYGTQFQQKAWEALREIPYGEIRTYTEQAMIIGSPKAIRAVGTANGRNPLSIVVPCHRVIAASGKLGGFAGGLDIKQKLLQLEAQYR